MDYLLVIASLEAWPVVVGDQGDAVGAGAEFPEEACGGRIALEGEEDGVERVVWPCRHGTVKELYAVGLG